MAKVKVKVILNVDEEVICKMHEGTTNETLIDAVMAEMELAKQSGITIEKISNEDDEQDILDRMGEITCPKEQGGSIERDKAIIAYLRSLTTEMNDEQANGHEFELNGKKYEIVMWEPCDHFNLGQLIEHIGL